MSLIERLLIAVAIALIASPLLPILLWAGESNPP